jgi:hypothetical protein
VQRLAPWMVGTSNHTVDPGQGDPASQATR